MSGLELLDSIRALRDCVVTVTRRQLRADEEGTRLERRVRELESRLARLAPEEQDLKPARAGGSKAAPVAVDASAEGGYPDVEEPLVEHRLGESVWEAAALAGLPGLSRSSSALLLLSLALCAAAQLYVCAVVLASGHFAQGGRFRSLEAPMRQWRLASGHDEEYRDASGKSLASRVCGDDPSLLLAGRQVGMLSEINAYLGLGAGDLEPAGTGTGPLLCGVCVFVFAAVALRELRSAGAFAQAALAVPRGFTRLEAGRFVELSCGRCVWVLAASALRAGVAAVLLYTGIAWLASTPSVTDIILITAALGFIADLDECLFQTTVPAGVHLLVRGLAPLRYRRSRWRLEAVVPLVAVGTAVLLCWLALVRPNVADMLAVKRAMCAGNRGFTVALSPAGFAVSRPATPWEVASPLDLKAAAARELMAATGPASQAAAQFSSYVSGGVRYRQQASATIADLARSAVDCRDRDDLPTPHLQHRLTAVRFQVGPHAGVSLAKRPFLCEEYASFCHASALLRNVCPATCGCDDPWSGLLRAKPSAGCPEACQAARHRRLANASCANTGAGSSSGWLRYWRELGNAAAAGAAEGDPLAGELGRLAAGATSGGCNAAARSAAGGPDLCSDTHPYLRMHGLSSISSFCPAQCCTVPRPAADCPHACPKRVLNGTR